MIKITFIFIALFIYTQSLMASSKKYFLDGNFAVVCTDDNFKITKAYLLDVLESEKIYKRKIDLSSYGKSYDKKIENIIKRLETVSPLRSKLFDRFWNDIKSKIASSLTTPGTIILTDKYPQMGLSLPGCELEQVTKYKFKNSDPNPDYTISYDIWQALSEDHKAALVLHEIIYRVARYFWRLPLIVLAPWPDGTPQTYRYLNGLILSGAFFNLSPFENVEIMKRLEALFTTIDKISYAAISVSLYPNGKVKSGFIFEYAPFFGGKNLGSAIFQGKEVKFEGLVNFYPDGKLSQACLSNTRIEVGHKLFHLQGCEGPGFNIKILPDETITEFIHLENKKYFHCKYADNKVSCIPSISEQPL